MDTAQDSCQICISKTILPVKWKEQEDAQIALYTYIIYMTGLIMIYCTIKDAMRRMYQGGFCRSYSGYCSSQPFHQGKGYDTPAKKREIISDGESWDTALDSNFPDRYH